MRSALVTTFVVGMATAVYAQAAYAQAASPASNPTVATTPTTSSAVPMVTAPAATGPNTASAPASAAAAGEPQPGANSFTEAQARARLDRDGFADVSGLAKDKDGIWRGKAMKDAKSVEVAVDYQGKIVAR